jgi:hypothetical protein
MISTEVSSLAAHNILQISALHIFVWEVLFAYGAVEKPVGGGYIPLRLINVFVPDKEEDEILADVLREERAKMFCDSSMDDADQKQQRNVPCTESEDC